MKDLFPCYYKLTETELASLFDDCYFIIDTNALLDILRLGDPYTHKVLALFDKYKDRIRIPYHVAEEYHDNLLDVITEQKQKLESVLREYTQEGIKSFSNEILKKYLPQVVIDEYNKKLSRVTGAFIKELKEKKDRIDDEYYNGAVQREMAKQFKPLLLEPLSNEEVKSIEMEGEQRYASKIPPGYKDAGKDNNQFGDLIIWKEIIKFAEANHTSVIFVSRDLKEDWILELHGLKCGPRIELIKEFKERIPDKLFHIYTLDKFIEYASNKEAVFNEKELQEMRSYLSEKEDPIKVVPDLAIEKDLFIDANTTPGDEAKKTGEDFKAV